MKRPMLTVMMTVALATPAMAQDPGEAEAKRQAAVKIQAELAQKITSVRIQTRITTGAPYSAESVTESTQALADGNRIVRKTITRVYRDGEGRSRQEEVDPETGSVRSVSITDPVAGSSYTLDPSSRTAYQSGVNIATTAGFAGVRIGGGGRGAVATARSADVTVTAREKAEAEAAAASAVRTTAVASGAGGRGRVSLPNEGQTTREELGQQTVEGVAATGTRATTVIPAGAIGNLQPVKIVSEQWMSPDLKVLVLTRHSDPRTGETIYRLSNIVRAEPDRSLFVVPPDYTLKDPRARRDP